ncbi:MAG TPA: hypothetical protein VF144_05420, partial [Chitinophagaceae bacterium]
VKFLYFKIRFCHMQITSSIDRDEIQEWISNKLSVQMVEALLQTRGLEAETISLLVKEFNKERYAIRRSRGFICASIGAIAGFIGCVLALLNPLPELYYLGLYGFTSLAAILICVGLYFLLE